MEKMAIPKVTVQIRRRRKIHREIYQKRRLTNPTATSRLSSGSPLSHTWLEEKSSLNHVAASIYPLSYYFPPSYFLIGILGPRTSGNSANRLLSFIGAATTALTPLYPISRNGDWISLTWTLNPVWLGGMIDDLTCAPETSGRSQISVMCGTKGGYEVKLFRWH